MNRWIVLTTIQAPTKAVQRLFDAADLFDWRMVVVGDRKTPNAPWRVAAKYYEFLTYLSVEDQSSLGALAERTPLSHYARKNLGYLFAIRAGADLIYETDDDNFVYDGFLGQTFAPNVAGRVGVCPTSNWVNAYRYFTDQEIWPRGLPLSQIRNPIDGINRRDRTTCPIRSYLVNEDPDVDAVYRLMNVRATTFRQEEPVILRYKSWCPFNTQNTIIFPEAFPLLWNPGYVAHRACDIWRGFVALAVLHKHERAVSFHAPTAFQRRNAHNLLADFTDEVTLHTQGERFMQTIDAVARAVTVAETARACWLALVENRIIIELDLEAFDAWLEAIK